MQSEVDLLKQRITELKARKAELGVENAEIPELRKKLAEVEARNGKLIKQIMEENNRRDAKIKNTTDRVAKLEQKQLLNDNAPNNNSSDFNSGENHHEKSLEDKEIDAFLIGVYKKSISDEIRRCNKEKTIQHEVDVQDDASGPACITDIVAIVNNLDELGSQSINKINSYTSTESSCEIEVIANTSQDHAQKYIANSIVPHNIKTVNLVNDQDKLAVEPSIVTEFIQRATLIWSTSGTYKVFSSQNPNSRFNKHQKTCQFILPSECCKGKNDHSKADRNNSLVFILRKI
ncbi:hypothetical protein RhiirB3_505626 [Rhizophagus irregularis]|nr:hypothetical protein RhiirB3_505626 [Rhizophagus irregularis]